MLLWPMRPARPEQFVLEQEFVGKLGLKADERVLDVGCGIGGGDFYIAAEYGAFVHGLDLSSNMVLIGLERTATTAGAAKVCCTAPSCLCLACAACMCASGWLCGGLCGCCIRGLVWTLGVVQVSFEIADVTTYEVKKPLYDVVYSRDTLLHIQDKPALFNR